MTEATRPDRELATARETVLNHVKELMRRHKVDLDHVVFMWEHGAIYKRWFLNIFIGAMKQTLTFMSADLQEWPRHPEIAGKYAVGILKVIERLKAA